MDAASAERLAALYDWLSRFNLLANWIALGHPRADLTMHKALRIPAELEPRYPKPERRLYVVDRALAAADLPAAPRVLDAGCGFGGTVFRWHERVGGSYDGLTVSRVQVKVARGEARRRGIAGDCRFHLASYDAPLTEAAYDAVVTIEALLHSPALDCTVANLASALRPGGRLVLVEDVPCDEAAGDPDLETVLRLWSLGAVATARDYAAALAAAGLRVLHDEDLTGGVPARPPAALAAAERRYRRVRALLPWRGARLVADAFLGGLAFERLYRRGLIRYRLLVAEKPPAPARP